MADDRRYRGLGREPKTDTEWDAVLAWQEDNPLWIVLHDPESLEHGDGGPDWFECRTEKVFGLLGALVDSHCLGPGPEWQIKVRCRTCGERTFVICGTEVDDILDGVAHVKPWCVYCTEAVAAHEVVEVLEW